MKSSCTCAPTGTMSPDFVAWTRLWWGSPTLRSVDGRSVLDRMLRRNPLAAMALHRPARSLSLQHLQLAEEASVAAADGGNQQSHVDQAEEAAEVLTSVLLRRARRVQQTLRLVGSQCVGVYCSPRKASRLPPWLDEVVHAMLTGHKPDERSHLCCRRRRRPSLPIAVAPCLAPTPS